MVFNAPLKKISILTLTVTDEDYSRNASYAKIIIGKVVTSSQHTAQINLCFLEQFHYVKFCRPKQMALGSV